jgi:hypothetical protein
VLTASDVIEIKYFRLWKHALGQVLAYYAFFTEKRTRLHLLAEASEAAAVVKVAELAEPICNKFNVSITLDNVSDFKRKFRS